MRGVMIKPENLKIVTVSFVSLAFLAGFVAQVLFETLSVSVGFFAPFYSQDIFRHGIPFITGLGLFLYLYLNKEAKTLADEVVTEVRKIVWPTKKELYAMSFVVCLILILSGAALGVFDLIAGTSVDFFLE